MKNKYRHMMEEVTLSPAARSAIEETLNAVPQKRRIRPLRAAIAAACICLLIPVTALGVAYLQSTVTLGRQTSSVEKASYNIVTDVTQRSLDDFSDALRADLAEGTLRRVYNDKRELEEYLGISLIRSTALEEAGIVEDLAKSFQYGWDFTPELAVDTSARYILSAENLDGTENTTDPQVLKISSHRVMENSEIYLDAWIITDSVTREQLAEGFAGEDYDPVTMHYLEFPKDEDGNFLLDENGDPTVIMRQKTSAEQVFSSQNYPMPNGDTATIITAETVEPTGSRGFHDYMGYFLHDGILYTVKPYGIYDPHQDYPMNDYDMLTVLKVVLDTFE